jgi:hypothetical protein
MTSLEYRILQYIAERCDVNSPPMHHHIRARFQETGTDLAKFLGLGNLESLSDMPKRDFEKAKGLLVAKKMKAAKQ